MKVVVNVLLAGKGTGWMEKVLHRLEYGHGKMSDIDLLVDVSKKIEGNTICPLGDASGLAGCKCHKTF